AARPGRVARTRPEEELAHAGSAPAPRVHEGARRAEAVDPVGAVADEDGPVRSGRHRADRRQLARAGPGGADVAAERAVGPEDLHGVRALVADVHRAVGPDGHRLGEAQHAAAALPDRERARVRARGRRARAAGRRGGGRREDGGDAEQGDTAPGAHVAAEPARAPKVAVALTTVKRATVRVTRETSRSGQLSRSS